MTSGVILFQFSILEFSTQMCFIFSKAMHRIFLILSAFAIQRLLNLSKFHTCHDSNQSKYIPTLICYNIYTRLYAQLAEKQRIQVKSTKGIENHRARKEQHSTLKSRETPGTPLQLHKCHSHALADKCRSLITRCGASK